MIERWPWAFVEKCNSPCCATIYIPCGYISTIVLYMFMHPCFLLPSSSLSNCLQKSMSANLNIAITNLQGSIGGWEGYWLVHDSFANFKMSFFLSPELQGTHQQILSESTPIIIFSIPVVYSNTINMVSHGGIPV